MTVCCKNAHFPGAAAPAALLLVTVCPVWEAGAGIASRAAILKWTVWSGSIHNLILNHYVT